jgi:ATP-dependent DNA helicase RecG
VENVLSRLGLIRNGRLTNAADVLFCPSTFVRLKMGMLASHARTEILDLHQMEGTLFSLLREAEWYILNHTRRRFVIDGFGPRTEIPEIPREAVREILLNAFTHRDWLSSASVQVDIYNDSVEICNPGWFIEGQDPSEHLAGEGGSSLSRNMLIARTLYRCGDVEAYGSGIPRVRDLCAEAGVRIEYVRTSWGTKFVFHRNDAFIGNVDAGGKVGDDGTRDVGENVGDVGENGPDVGENVGESGPGVGENDAVVHARVLALIREDPSVSAQRIASHVGLSDRQVERILARMKGQGMIRRVGPARGGCWEVL